MLWWFVTDFDKSIKALQSLWWRRTGLPAVCGLGGQDVGKEHLSQLPEVEELISATAKGDMEVRTVFLQGSLLKILCVLYYRGEQESRVVCYFADILGWTHRKDWKVHDDTFLSCFANYFNVLHGNFKKFPCDEWCHIHLREREKKINKCSVSQHPETLTPHSPICHLLGSTDQHSCKEAQSHPQLVHKSLIICDVSEKKYCTVTSVTITHYTASFYIIWARNTGKMAHLYQGYTKFSRTSSRILGKKNKTELHYEITCSIHFIIFF